VANDGKVNIEEVLRLKPDLVLAWRGGNRAADIERLQSFGLPVVVTRAAQIEDVAKLLRAIGELAGTQSVAQASALKFEHEISSLRNRYASRTPVRSFIEIWHTPLMTVNGKHYISSIVNLCGGVNVFGQTASLTPTISREQLYATDIQAILSLAFKAPQRARAVWAGAEALPAVRAGHVYGLDPNLLSRLSPRLAQGAAQLCAALDRARMGASSSGSR
jgi:iron complex transport system substrate-binding protein